MTNTIIARDISLHDLENSFKLQFNEDSQFFPEWQTNTIKIDKQERKLLDKVKASYINLSKYPTMLENAVQLTVLSPLLHLADLLLPPFHLRTETSVQISSDGDDLRIEGRIDILLLKEHFWVLVIESKRAELAPKVGLAQILAYMLANPNKEKPSFGLVTNGGSFVFVKLVNGTPPTYGFSRVFELLNPGNDLYQVLIILKQLGQSFLIDEQNKV